MQPALLLGLAGGVAALVWLVLTTALGRNPVVVLSVLSLFAVDATLFAADLDWVQKALAAAVLVVLLTRFGMRLSFAALGAVAVFTVVLVLDLLPSGGPAMASTAVAVRAYAGYLIPWLFLLVRWRRDQVQGLLRAAMYLPAMSLPYGALLQVAGVATLFSSDGTAVRYAGASIPATLALSAVVGVFAAALELVLFRSSRHAGLWLVIDLVIVVITLTRGAIVASGIVVAALAVWSFTAAARQMPVARRIARWTGGLLLVAVVLALPSLLDRSAGNSYEGAFNTSGREQAWPFYLSLWSQYPWLGRGLGFASIAVAVYMPLGVQKLTAPHDEYIHLLVDGGVLLLVAFLVLLAVLFIGTLRAVPAPARIVVAAMAVALLGYAASDNPFSTPQFLVPFMVVMSALAALRRPAPTIVVHSLPKRELRAVPLAPPVLAEPTTAAYSSAARSA